MAAAVPVQNETTHEISTCFVEASPSEVDAGADLTLKGEVSCAAACDLRGQPLLIKDQDGALVGSMELTQFDGETNQTGEFVVRAPAQVGAFAWLAMCPAHEDNGISHMEGSAPISFSVRPHKTSVVVWDVPSAIPVGERFRIKVGIKCSSQCRLTDRQFEIYDHEGKRAATGRLQADTWPGSAALYFAEVELEAPEAAGRHRWEARILGSDMDLPHGEGSSAFGVIFVRPPESLVTIKVVDSDKQTPIKGAHVLMHPYRASTDERGVAELRVPKGAYTIFVSGPKYLSLRMDTEITGDLTSKAELTLEPVRERN